MTQFKMYPWQKETYEIMVRLNNGSMILTGIPPRGGKSIWHEQMRSMQSIIRMYRQKKESKNTLTLKQYKRRISNESYTKNLLR